MVKRAFLVKFLIWFLAAASLVMWSYAAAVPKVSDSNIHPQGCRCCNFVYYKSLITCGKVCCQDGCC
ncbi:hypothetical protein L6452_19441 [Arctium lappa]|uniref:Uncharacterized protein n=1 Tax=Arctium lappa TaxID=4217 RepID=A0ACB9B858_ARCLA|nr:hypothetical protein L6452_19441 [Arctium lappa]